VGRRVIQTIDACRDNGVKHRRIKLWVVKGRNANDKIRKELMKKDEVDKNEILQTDTA